MSKHIELAKKLKALADRGIGGEKLNAEKMLETLLKKHNLTIDDIEGEKTDDYFFKLNENEHRLWYQIVKSVNTDIKCYGEFPKKDIKLFELKGNYCIKSTLSEYIEIEAKLSIYKRLYEEESDIFFHAFCTANNLLITPKKQIDISDLDDNELKTLLRVRQMSRNIKSEHYRKQLFQKEGNS
jgi:hypothetical protein